jgi:phosphoglycerol geranylgeranyltransferase
MANINTFILGKRSTNEKLLAILIDPDKVHLEQIKGLVEKAEPYADLLFVGGSLLVTNHFNDCISEIKKHTHLPVIIFPGSPAQISSEADGILLLSLISGRNPELLIGQHVIAATKLKESRLEILPTGYMLIESGNLTTALYMSNTLPIPSEKPEIAACTALAGEQLGLKYIYLDGGSGAAVPVHAKVINAVRKSTSLPLIVGGGIKTPEQAQAAFEAGADIIVIGTAFENDRTVLESLSKVLKSCASAEDSVISNIEH